MHSLSLLKDVDLSQGYFDKLIKSTRGINTGKGFGSINPPKGLFEPDEHYYRWNVDPRGIRDRFYNITYDILRDIARRVAPVTAVHILRGMQVRPFSVRAYNEDETGYVIKIKDKKRTPDRKESKVIDEIEDFILNAGYVFNDGTNDDEDEREGMQEVNDQLVRELLGIDQVAATIRYNRKGKMVDYWLLDGATIKRTVKGRGYEGDKEIRFVQELDGRVVETFTKDDIVFYYANRRVSIKHKGYGYSYIEMCLDMITSWLFGMTYNKEFFNTSTQPKGILTFEGDKIDQGQLEELQRQWISMFRGIKGLWKTPFLQYNAKWQPIAPSNRDMEFNEYIQILSSWIFAIHGTDSQEVGMRLNQAQNVLNENVEGKLAFSKSRALRFLLSSIASFYNKIIQKDPEWRKYYLTFTGLEAKDQKAELEVDEKQVKIYMTIDEKRAEKDLKPLPNNEGEIILDPTYIQYKMQKEQTEQMGQGQDFGNEGEQGFGNEEEQGGEFELDASKLKPEGEEEEVEKSLKEEYIEIII